MTKPKPIRNEDNTHLAGSIGAGKYDIPQPVSDLTHKDSVVTDISQDITYPKVEQVAKTVFRDNDEFIFPFAKTISAVPSRRLRIGDSYMTPLGVMGTVLSLQINNFPMTVRLPNGRTIQITENRTNYQEPIHNSYASFKEETLTKTQALLKALENANSLEKKVLYEGWLKDMSNLYELPSTLDTAWMQDISNSDKVNSDSHPLKLFRAFRLAQLESTETKTLPSLSERTDKPIIVNSRCYSCGFVTSGESTLCPNYKCGHPMSKEINDYHSGEKAKIRNNIRDAHAWSESLYNKINPEEYERLYLNHELGRDSYTNIED